MGLGLCCHYVEVFQTPQTKEIIYKNIVKETCFQLGRYKSGCYTDTQIKTAYINNISVVLNNLDKISKLGISAYRLSSSILPLADTVKRELWDNEEVKSLFLKLGNKFKELNIRVITHPGQFCVLSSDSSGVVDTSINELVMHAWMFDSMGFEESPYYAINIHGGKKDRSEQLARVIDKLPSNVQNRLTLENDECAYSVLDLLHIHQSTGIPIILDSHHHSMNEGNLSLNEAFAAANETWGNIKPIGHLSNTEIGLENASFIMRRKHSNFIRYIPECQLEALRNDKIDLEIEAKMKNLAITDIQNKFLS